MLSYKDVEVRYQETDLMGIVHHSSYIVWFELARVQFLRDCQFQLEKLEDEGYYLPVVDVYAKYHRPVKFENKITVRSSITYYDGLTVKFHYDVLNENEETCVTGFSSHVCVKKSSFRPVRIAKALPYFHQVVKEVVRSSHEKEVQ